VLVDFAEVVVDVALVVVVVVLAVVVAVVPPKLKTQLYALTDNTASVPTKGSVPAPMLSTYWLVVKAALPSVVRYVKNSLRSPEKLVISL